MGNQNPWAVESIEAFSFYCCPECDFLSKDGDHFKRHAIESHKKSKVFFIVSKPENTAHKDPLEVETESGSQDESEEAMEDFDASDTRVKEESISKLGLEKVNENKTADFFEEDVNTIDEQEAEVNVEEVETFDGENYKNITEAETSNHEERNNMIEEERKRTREFDIEREKKKKKLRAILDKEDTDEESAQVSKTKYASMKQPMPDASVNTPKYAQNYLTLKEKMEMIAILEKRVTEDKNSVKIENQKIQDPLSDEIFVVKSGSDFSTDEDSDQALNKNSRNNTKPRPCTKKSAKNYLSLEEKLEIIKLRENGERFSKIARDKNMNESSIRALYGRREKIKIQATLSNPSQYNVIKRTRSMEEMEGLLSLWVQDLDQRGIHVGTKEIQTKAKYLYLQVKDNFADKTETEIKETFLASNGWFDLYKKRHNIKIGKLTGKAKSADHYAATPSDLIWHIKIVHEKKKEHKCEMCHQKFSLKNALTNHIKTIHEAQRLFLKKQNLNDQKEEVHMTNKAFKFKDCNESFSRKENMESHERYTCNECKISFSQKEQIESHVNIVHLNEKPYKCNLCEESFIVDSQLKQHLKGTHRICGEKIPLFE